MSFPEPHSDEGDEIPPDKLTSLAYAMMEFNGKFSEYIKEVDVALWKKAVDYAVTFTEVDGIVFEYVIEPNGEDSVVANIEWEEILTDEELEEQLEEQKKHKQEIEKESEEESEDDDNESDRDWSN